MQSPLSSDFFQGMRLSRFRQHCASRKNPVQRQVIQGQPFWTTSDGKILWLAKVPVRDGLVSYQLQTCTLDEYRQKPMIQRGVVRFDRYYPPRRPDTPILKRRAKVVDQIRSYPFPSYVSSLRPPSGLVDPHSRKVRPHSQKKHFFRPPPLLLSRTAPDEHSQQPDEAQKKNPLRLKESIDEIGQGDLPDRVGHFLQRAAGEIPTRPEQTENRWFGIDQDGHLILTRSSWLSFFFPK